MLLQCVLRHLLIVYLLGSDLGTNFDHEFAQTSGDKARQILALTQ
jgi:hypothetical protein